MLETIKYWTLRGAVGMILYLLGGWSTLLKAMFIFIVTDYCSGIIKSIYLKEVSSKVATRGIVKKTGYLLAVILGAAFDEVVKELGVPSNMITLYNIELTARDLVILSIIGTEGISIMENLGAMDILIPASIKKFLEQINQNDKRKD